MPSFAKVASIGLSSGAGGFVVSNSAISPKKATGIQRFTCSRTAVFMSMDASTFPGGGV